MIRQASFREFRALRSVDVTLEPLTVFVGPNGSGKTSVLEGIQLVVQAARQPLHVVLGKHQWEFEHLLRRRSTNTLRVHLDFELIAASLLTDSTSLELEADIDYDAPGPGLSFHVSMRTYNRAGNMVQEWDPAGHTPSTKDRLYRELYKLAEDSALLTLNPRSLSAPSYSDAEVPAMLDDGEGLASVLADLATRRPENSEAILEAVQRVVPSVRRIRAERAPVIRVETEMITIGNERIPHRREQKLWGHRIRLDTTSGDDIPLHSASEGTILTLGLMTILHSDHIPRTLLMDDLDRALHPRAQQELVSLLRKSLDRWPWLQIIATSHSPFLLDALEHKEVRVTTLAEDGSVLCAPLGAHPDFEKWKNQVRPGELWTADMESWLRAAPKAAS